MIAINIFLASMACVVALLSLVTGAALRDRPMARLHREKFMALADEMVSKREVPDLLAWHMVMVAHAPPGALARAALKGFVIGLFGGNQAASAQALTIVKTIMGLPPGIKERFVLALFHLSAADSYRSQIAGPIWRTTHRWVFEAIGEIKPDVNSHSTTEVIRQVAIVKTDRRVVSASRLGDCVPA